MTKQYANLYAVSYFPWEAQVWMNTAVRLDYESNRPLKNSSNIDHNKLNVAHVCTGLAFELAYKSLIIADFKPIEKTHKVEKLHGMLKEKTQVIVERYIMEVGWKDSASLLKYLDESMTHSDRKYWMENPWKKGGAGTGFVIADGIMSIPGLTPILCKLVNLGIQNLDKARKYLYDIDESLDNYEKAKEGQGNLTNSKNKVLDTIKAFRNNYGNTVNLNRFLCLQIPDEIAEMLDFSDNISIENHR